MALFSAATGDRLLLERAEAWLDNRETHPLVEPAALAVRHIRAAVDGRLEEAADIADDAWRLLDHVRGVRSWALIEAVVNGLAVGRVERAGGLVDAYATDVGTFGALPCPRATLLRCQSLLAIEQGRDDRALDAAHAVVDQAHAAGLHLLTIDGLETIAELMHRRNTAVPAARLFGAAAAAARAAIGYHRRNTPHPAQLDTLVDGVAADRIDAFTEGQTLTIGDAIAYARRARGERTRPNHGWSSLTPTEQRVTQLVAQGHTNDQVAPTAADEPDHRQTHLNHIFANLGVANRTELAAAHANRPSRR